MSKYRPVNRGLDIEPLIFFIRADMFMPWAVILLAALLAKGMFAFSWMTTIFIAVWGMATWWILTYKGAWRFLSKFVISPKWIRGQGSYPSLVKRQDLSKKSAKVGGKIDGCTIKNRN